jgi:DnaJ-class molecular chaperone
MRKKIIITVLVLGLIVTGIVWARNIICEVCNGSRTQICLRCDGEGWVPHATRPDAFISGCTDCGGGGWKAINGSYDNNFREGRGKVPCGACDGKGYQTVSDSDD